MCTPWPHNESAVGLDLMSVPEVVPFVETAVQERRMTVSDPILTVQGSLAIVVRDPLFNEADFLGMVQGVFDIDALLQEALGVADPRFAVQVADATGNRFWGVEDLLGDTDTVMVPVGDNVWTLTVGWQSGEPGPTRFILWLIWAGGGALLLSLFLIVERTWSRTERLQSAVAKRTEALTKSEEKFRKAFYTSSDSININRLEDGLYVEINRGFTQITGYSEADAVGRTSSEINIWADPKDRNRLVTGLRQNGEVHNLEAQFRKKDGSLVDGLMSSALIDLDGVPHIISITRDITERKRAEQEIRYQANLIEDVSDAIVSTDLNFGIRSWNKAAERIYGWSAAEAIGKSVGDMLPTVYPDDSQAEVLQTFRDAGFWKGDVIQQNRAGASLDILSSVSLIQDGEGNPTGTVAVNRDITERKLAEAALRASEAFAQNIINSLNAHIAVLDAQGVIVAVNLAWQKFARQNGGDDVSAISLGANYFAVCEKAIDWQADEYAAAALHGIRAVMDRSLPAFSFEYPCDAPDEPRWFAMQVLPLEGAHTGIVVAHENITERKLAESQRLVQVQRTQKLLNTSLDGFILADTEADRGCQPGLLRPGWLYA